jgi:hypothetical protein
MPDTFALFLAVGIIGTSIALASAILFEESRSRQRTIEHYRKLERERILRVRRLQRREDGVPAAGGVENGAGLGKGRWRPRRG